MTIDENWGIAIHRVRAFFDAQPDVMPWGNGYRYHHCTITLTEIPPSQQSILAIPRTQLLIEGPDEEAAAIHRRFFLRFLSAGG